MIAATFFDYYTVGGLVLLAAVILINTLRG